MPSPSITTRNSAAKAGSTQLDIVAKPQTRRVNACAAACLAVATAAALLGCAGTTRPPPPAPAAVNLAGFPPAFRDGYAAGCDSAKRRAIRRDEARFKSDRQYANGWRDGLDACTRQARPAQ